MNWSDDEATAYIWTAQRTVITKLEANPAATKVQGGHVGSTEWAEFRFPAKLVTFRKGTPAQSAETRAKRVEAIKAARARRQPNDDSGAA